MCHGVHSLISLPHTQSISTFHSKGVKFANFKLIYKVIVEVDFLWRTESVDSLKTSFHPLLWTSSGDDLMKSTAVDESLSSMNQQFCSRENQLLQLLQQNEKSTPV